MTVMKFRAMTLLAVALAVCPTASVAKLRLFAPARHKAPAKLGPQPAPYQWTLGNAPQAHKDLVATFGRVGLNPGEYLWTSAVPTQGDTRVVIDRLTQMFYVYRADKLVGAAHVSTAKQGHITPLGEWKILEKRPFYRSKKYDNAPMPWMERIDEYGIALHGGGTPGHPESHGCIHLPTKFAEKLYSMTKIGTKVIIEG